VLAPRILIFIAIFVVYDKLAAIFLILTTHCIVTAYRVITWGNEQHLLSRIVCKYKVIDVNDYFQHIVYTGFKSYVLI